MNKNSDTGVYQLDNGHWGFRFKCWVNGKEVFRNKRKGSDGKPFLTKKAAMMARKAALLAAQTGKPQEAKPPAPTMTFRDIFMEYCEKGRSDRAYQTVRKQDSIWQNHLNAEFGDRFIEDISVAEINDYLARLYYEDGLAYRYVESFLKMFYLIYGQAYSRGYLAVDLYNRMCKNKDSKIHMPKLKVDEDLTIVAFTNDELAVMDQFFKGTNAETAYMLGRYCGLRINECYGLKWSQVDLESGVIHIEQQMMYVDSLIRLVPLKTRNARRDILMGKRLLEYMTAAYAEREKSSVTLAAQRDQNQKFVIDTNGSKLSCLELVNCLPNGKIQTVNSMKYYSRTLKEKYGIDFKYHHLRHTYGTQLAVLNTPAHILCNQMGHGNIHVTERYYIAISQNGLDALKRNLDRL